MVATSQRSSLLSFVCSFAMAKKARTQRNTSGLRHQQSSHDVPLDSPSDTIIVFDPEPIERDPPEELDPDDDYGPSWNPHAERVSLKPAMVLVDDDLDGERDEFVATKEMLGDEATERWVAFAEKEGDKVEDEEWLSPKEKANKKKNEANKTHQCCSLKFRLWNADLK